MRCISLKNIDSIYQTNQFQRTAFPQETFFSRAMTGERLGPGISLHITQF